MSGCCLTDDRTSFRSLSRLPPAQHVMFRIKICGVTNVEDALAAVAAGADAIGLNFYPRSPRFVELSQARHIIDALEGRAVAVGVFVNATVEAICETAERLGLDQVQLSGDEPPEMLDELTMIVGDCVLRTFRVAPGGYDAQRVYLETCRELGCVPHRILWDAFDSSAYGGTGRRADWDLAARLVVSGELPPLVLAGGLRAENVEAAILAVRPVAVDTASGVESSPGRKDPEQFKRFVAAARAAFDKLTSAD